MNNPTLPAQLSIQSGTYREVSCRSASKCKVDRVPSITEESRAGLLVIAFQHAAAFATWLAGEPRTSKGMWLKLARTDSGLVSVPRVEAVDAALCHGWIDGQQERYDETSRLVRFTPRTRTRLVGAFVARVDREAVAHDGSEL